LSFAIGELKRALGTFVVAGSSPLDEGARSASVRAQTRADLIKVDVPGFLNLVASEPEFSRAVMRVMSRRLRMMNRRYGEAIAGA
jgi:CRP-like cAMP-binding protein